MSHFCRCILIAGITLHLMGCSYLNPKFNLIEQRQKEYLNAQTVAPLQIPNGMKITNAQQSYPIPNVTTTSAMQPSLLPPNSLAAQITQGKLSPDVLRQREALAQTVVTKPEIPSAAVSYVNNDTLIVNQSITKVWHQTEIAIDKAGYKIAFKNAKTLTYYIVDTSNTRGKITRESPIYQIHLRRIPLGVEIAITNNMGKPVDINIANRILDTLYNGFPTASAPLNANKPPVTQGVTPDSAPTSNFGQLMRRFFN